MRKLESLRLSLKVVPRLKYLFLGRLFRKLYKHGSGMSVGYGNSYTLCSYYGSVSLYYLSVFNVSPDSERLLLALLFLTADKGNDVIDHFGPFVKGLSGAAYSLIGSCDYFGGLIFKQWRKHRNV